VYEAVVANFRPPNGVGELTAGPLGTFELALFGVSDPKVRRNERPTPPKRCSPDRRLDDRACIWSNG
jgi:hypothetical protein